MAQDLVRLLYCEGQRCRVWLQGKATEASIDGCQDALLGAIQASDCTAVVMDCDYLALNQPNFVYFFNMLLVLINELGNQADENPLRIVRARPELQRWLSLSGLGRTFL